MSFQNFHIDHRLTTKELARIRSQFASKIWQTVLVKYFHPSMILLSIFQLVGLLKDKNPVVRQLALENLLPYTQSGNPHLDVWKASNWEGGRTLKILTRDMNVRPRIYRTDSRP